jgi:hypothetical protein
MKRTLKVVETLHYCKADKKLGTPLNVTDMVTKKIKKTAHWKMLVLDPKTLEPILLKCDFNNSTGKAKASGASAVLQILR